MSRIECRFPWCKDYGMESVVVNTNNDLKCLNIYNSAKIKKIKHIKEVLKYLKTVPECKEIMVLPMWLLTAEWKTHNLLYNINYEPNRTQHLDIESKMPTIYKFGYVIASLFYWKF